MAASDAERIKAIQKALCHPMFYDGDMGADIRWLLARVELLGDYERVNARDYAHAAKVGGLEQLLDDYRACEDNDCGSEWYWLDEIEKRIGRERYRQIMFPKAAKARS